MSRDHTLMPPGTPQAEVEIDASLIRRLLEEQQPDLAELDLRRVAHGWDNETWHLGENLALRLPRRLVSAALLRNEQRWLPSIARRVSLPVPAPVWLGRPSDDYPWAWSVVPWIEGIDATRHPLDPTEAPVLGRFLRELHVPAPAEAPTNDYRGVPLEERSDSFEDRIGRLAEDAGEAGITLEIDRIRLVWQQAIEAPIDHSAVWLHGDLHPRNVLTQGGRLVAAIDWGDLTRGDPATDLASLWMLFPLAAHDSFYRSYGPVSPSLRRRARGWAALFGAILLDTGSVDDPAFAVVGRTTLERLCERL